MGRKVANKSPVKVGNGNDSDIMILSSDSNGCKSDKEKESVLNEGVKEETDSKKKGESPLNLFNTEKMGMKLMAGLQDTILVTVMNSEKL